MAKKESHHHAHQASHTHHVQHSHAHPHQQHPQHQEHHTTSIDEKVMHNLVELQKVHTDLAEKFTKLSDQISSLLNLFELSARAFAKQVNIPNVEKDREFLEKIDKLLDQNKTLAKGLMLMEERIRDRAGQASPQMQPSNFQRSLDAPRPLPRF